MSGTMPGPMSSEINKTFSQMACCLLGVSQEGAQSWGSVSIAKKQALDAGEVGVGEVEEVKELELVQGDETELSSEG